MNLAGLRILVLEDEPIIAMALEELLEDDGARPTVVATLAQAFEALEDAGFDAAVLDINVHGEKSYTVGQRLLELGTPFAFASGYGDTLNPPEFAHVPTVTKPYNSAEIASALERARQG
jgi:CheY-like chemotaxis protein